MTTTKKDHAIGGTMILFIDIVQKVKIQVIVFVGFNSVFTFKQTKRVLKVKWNT